MNKMTVCLSVPNKNPESFFFCNTHSLIGQFIKCYTFHGKVYPSFINYTLCSIGNLDGIQTNATTKTRLKL